MHLRQLRALATNLLCIPLFLRLKKKAIFIISCRTWSEKYHLISSAFFWSGRFFPIWPYPGIYSILRNNGPPDSPALKSPSSQAPKSRSKSLTQAAEEGTSGEKINRHNSGYHGLYLIFPFRIAREDRELYRFLLQARPVPCRKIQLAIRQRNWRLCFNIGRLECTYESPERILWNSFKRVWRKCFFQEVRILRTTRSHRRLFMSGYFRERYQQAIFRWFFNRENRLTKHSTGGRTSTCGLTLIQHNELLQYLLHSCRHPNIFSYPRLFINTCHSFI